MSSLTVGVRGLIYPKILVDSAFVRRGIHPKRPRLLGIYLIEEYKSHPSIMRIALVLAKPLTKSGWCGWSDVSTFMYIYRKYREQRNRLVPVLASASLPSDGHPLAILFAL